MAAKRVFLSPPHMCGEELKLIEKVFESNYIAPNGPMVERFEREFAESIGFKCVLALYCGTAALHLALRCLGIGKGDLVMVSTLTFIGSVTPSLFQGAEPVFIDSDRPTWNMDPALLRKAFASAVKAGRKPKAVVVTDIYGQCADYDPIKTLCDEYGALLLADSAESVGSLYKGSHAGRKAKAAAYSFNGNKIITCAGGGALASDDEELISYARKLSTQAREKKPYYEHIEYGYNYRLSNVLAAIAVAQLGVLEDRVKVRRAIFDRYAKELGCIPGVSFMPEASYGRSNRWLTVIQLDPKTGKTPEDLRLLLEADNIESRPVWKPMHMQPVFARAKFYGTGVSEEIFTRGLCLPSGTNLTEDEQSRIIEIVKRALTR